MIQTMPLVNLYTLSSADKVDETSIAKAKLSSSEVV
jgi:hypothetical protein